MPRTITPALIAALSQPQIEPYYGVEMLFDNGVLRFWTGHGTKTIAGNNYFGLGVLIGFSGAEEVSDLAAKSVTISVTGVPSTYITLALQEPYQGRVCRVYFGVGSEAIEIFGGYMDLMTIEDSGESAIITLTVESKLVDLERPRVQRYTHEAQQALYPGDDFFSYVTDLQMREVVWGRSKA